MVECWGEGAAWLLDQDAHPHEAQLLKLDISKAESQLKWHPRWTLESTLDRIIEWHRCWLSGGNVKVKTLEQISEYQSSR